MAETLLSLPGLGIGGALAAFIFFFYRKDVLKRIDDERGRNDLLVTVVRENTASNAKIVTLIENIERNSFRKSDIAELIDHRIRQHGDSKQDHRTIS